MSEKRRGRQRTGCIYQEVQRDFGKGRVQGSRGISWHVVKGVGKVTSERRRWVGEIMYYRKRYRFRSTNLQNVQTWLRDMKQKFGNN